MLKWFTDKLLSAVNFVGKIGEAISENPAFKATSFFTRLLFGIPLGCVRLLAVDLPLHAAVSVAKWSHTRFYKAAGIGEKEQAVTDATYKELSESANAMTSSFVKGFMFGSWLQIAEKVKTTIEDWQGQNYGTFRGSTTELVAKPLAQLDHMNNATRPFNNVVKGANPDFSPKYATTLQPTSSKEKGK